MERDEITMLVASNIEGIMAQKGLTAAKVAARAKLNPTGVYDILSGKSRSPRLDTIAKIAKALDVPVSRLFEEPREGAMREQLVSAFSRLPTDEQRRLVLTAQAWLGAPAP